MVELWSWLYTDEFGKRRIYRTKLSVEDASRLKDATRVEGTLEVWQPPGSTHDDRASNAASAEYSADPLLSAINRAMLIVSCLQKLSQNSEPGTKTLLAELSNELAGARMQLAMLRAGLVELEQKPPPP